MKLSDVLPSLCAFRNQFTFRNSRHSVSVSIVLAFLLTTALTFHAQQFQQPITTRATILTDQLIVAGDFNNDGKVDIAMGGPTGYGEEGIDIDFGNGDGTFVAGPTYPYFMTTALVTADVNGDKNLDLIVGDPFGDVIVLLGNGDGTFGAPITTKAGFNITCLGVADLNHDGNADVVACSDRFGFANNSIVSLLGHGDGTFGLPQPFAVGAHPSAVSIADFNNDGNLDLVVMNENSNSASVLLGKGDGTFQTQKAFPVGTQPVSVVAADFNHDGNQDLAVANKGSNNVTILFGTGNGNFVKPKSYNVPYASQIVAADFDRDGNPDLVVESYPGVTLLLGKGNGTFDVASFAAGGDSLAVGDFNGDGFVDVVAADPADLQVSVLLNNRNRTLDAPRAFLFSDSPSYAIGDFDRDGNLDVAVDQNTGFGILFGNGHGQFSKFSKYPFPGGAGPEVAADFNHDGKLDLALYVTVNQSGAVAIVLGNGNGTFQKPTIYTDFNVNGKIVAGDFNGDHIPDLAVATPQAIGIFFGNGDGTFRVAGQLSVSAYSAQFAAVDFNGDNKSDLAVVSDSEIDVYLSNGDGTFRLGSQNPENQEPAYIVAGDFNRDGRADFADADGGYGTAFVFLGNGDGTFVKSPEYGSGGVAAFSIATGDFNGDGYPDLLFTNNGDDPHNSPGYPGVDLNNGDGTFQDTVNFNNLVQPANAIAGDFNNDGADDLLVSNRGQALSVALNLEGTYIQLGSKPNPSKAGQPVTFAASVKRSVQSVSHPAGPSGTVTFYDGKNPLGTAPLEAGVAKFTTSKLSAGTHSIRALYSGDGNYNQHLSDVYKQQVNQ